MHAAIQAAYEAVRDYWRESGGWFRDSTYQGVAEAAVRAAEPILRQALAEDIARRIEVLEDYEAAEIAREVGRGE